MDGQPSTSAERCLDAVIVGAGISGINAAYRLQSRVPNCAYAVLEARNAIGGTWDLFRYPGIRSDSDLFTFGFSWNPWNQDNPIAEGAAVSRYLQESTKQNGIDSRIMLNHRLISADWSSSACSWTLNVNNKGKKKIYTARFVIFGTGYYDYDEPLAATIPGLDNFKGQVVHPQFWPEDLDYNSKEMVIIGSGSTAVTLLPKLSEKASRVTMLQRSPTYILSIPNSKARTFLSYILPAAVFRKVQRIGWILSSRLFFIFCQAFPRLSRWLLRLSVCKQLPKHLPHDPHFQPRYNPWDQRLCFCPNGDFFKSLHTGRADVKTDNIRLVAEKGILLKSGDEIAADIIVTATGLKLQIAGKVTIRVDGEVTRIPDKYMWNGVMLQDIPNASFIIGYTNASWTLGADATALFICRLLQEMEARELAAVIPRLGDEESKLQRQRFLNLNSSYVSLAEKDMPKVASQGPWQPRNSYLSDYLFATYGWIDESLELI